MSTETPVKSDEQPQVDEVVLLVHGIRDRAMWQSEIAEALATPSRVVIPIKYGFFSVFLFLCPLPLYWFRLWPLERKIRFARNQYRTARISIVAHSFGTYLTTRLLRRSKGVKYHRVVFCGTVVPTDQDWEGVANAFEESPIRGYFVNECGNADPWPALAEIASFRYGRSGADGFGGVAIRDRFHVGKHSVFLNGDFARTYWGPFFDDGKIVPGAVDKNYVSQLPFWISLLAHPIVTLITRLLVVLIYVTALALACWLGYKGLRQFSVKPELREVTGADIAEHMSSTTGREAKWIGYPVHFHGDLSSSISSQSPILRIDLLKGDLTIEVKRADGKNWDLPALPPDDDFKVCIRGKAIESTDKQLVLDLATLLLYARPDAEDINQRYSGCVLSLNCTVESVSNPHQNRARYMLKAKRAGNMPPLEIVAFLAKSYAISAGDNVSVQGKASFVREKLLLHDAAILAAVEAAAEVHADTYFKGESKE